jgi:glutathione S-transferase
MLYFAEGTQYLPDDPFDLAKVHQWLFWEQYSHEPCIAVARYWMHYLGRTEAEAPRLPELWEKGRAALGVMEEHLAKADFFVAGRYTIADIALYAYTHVAHQGGFDLGPYPAVRAWIGRVADQPRHIAIDDVVW